MTNRDQACERTLILRKKILTLLEQLEELEDLQARFQEANARAVTRRTRAAER